MTDVTRALALLGTLYEIVTELQEAIVDLQEEIESFEHQGDAKGVT